MIIGIGSDLIDIRRIEKSLERHGQRFIQRIYTEVEQARSEGRGARAASYAKRFAAKEACAKALGTGLAQGVFWRDMGVVNLPSGKPTMTFDRRGGRAAGQNPAARTQSGDPPHNHRRFPACSSLCDHRGVARRRSATLIASDDRHDVAQCAPRLYTIQAQSRTT